MTEVRQAAPAASPSAPAVRPNRNRQLGLQPGAEVVLELTDGELRIRSLRRTIERAQALVRRHVPETTSLADELIRERHEAARRE